MIKTLARAVAVAALLTPASPAAEAELPHLATVTLKGPGQVTLEIPGGYIDDSIAGRVLLKNDSDQPATIRAVSTSCGCTGAKPSTPTLQPGDAGDLLINFKATEIGEKNVVVNFRFGARQFQLDGLAETWPRFVVRSPRITFDSGRAQIELLKRTATKVERLVSLPATFKLVDFKDEPHRTTAVIVQDPDSHPAQITVIPEAADK